MRDRLIKRALEKSYNYCLQGLPLAGLWHRCWREAIEEQLESDVAPVIDAILKSDDGGVNAG